MTIAEALAAASIPRGEALLLLACASGYAREQLIARSADPLSRTACDAFEALARRRSEGEPIAYLLGRKEFYGREFLVDPCVLIPRPETELLVELALGWIVQRRTLQQDRALRVLDLGTGSGAIALTLLLECPGLDVTATDVSGAALEIAAQNIARQSGGGVRLVESDWFSAFDVTTSDPERFDLIVSNPPYIAAADRHLSEGDLRREPRSALTDEGDGLGAIRSIVLGAGLHLRPHGCVILEHGYDQAPAVRDLLSAAGFTNVASARDLAGIERVTQAHAARALTVAARKSSPPAYNAKVSTSKLKARTP